MSFSTLEWESGIQTVCMYMYFTSFIHCLDHSLSVDSSVGYTVVYITCRAIALALSQLNQWLTASVSPRINIVGGECISGTWCLVNNVQSVL